MTKVTPTYKSATSEVDFKEENDDQLTKNEQTDDYGPQGRFTTYLTVSLLVAAIGSGFQFGWSAAIFNTPSDIIKDFYKEVYQKNENGTEMSNGTLNTYWSITNGLFPLGGMFGGLSSGFAADYFGRKLGMILVNAFVVMSWILYVISKPIGTYITIMVGRFISGVYTGLFSGLLSLYLNECSSKNLRGFTGTMNLLSIVIGILVANVVGLPQLLGTDKLWPFLVGLTIVPAIVHLGLFFTPESPKFLYINRKDKVGAENVLKKLRNNDMELINYEMKELAVEMDNLQNQSEKTWGSFFRERSLFRPLVVTVGVQLAQQFSGINTVIFYSTDIFRAANLKDQWPIYGTIILGVVQIIMAIVCMFLIDRTGRKLLLLIGLGGMSVFSFLLTIFRVFGNEERQWLNYMTVVATVLYILFYSIGPGGIPWLITSELFSSESRGKATSIAVSTNWFSNFLVTVTFPFIESEINDYSFIIFGVLLILFFLFTLFLVPETKNKPIEKIKDEFDRKLIQWSFK